MDEPLDGLDPMIRSRVKKLLLADVAEREMSIVISSHNLRELEDICDYMGILHDGSIIIESELDTLKSGISKVQTAFPDGLAEDLLAAGFLSVDYVEARDAETLSAAGKLEGRPLRILAAARLGGARLIDNIGVEP